jgi:hypothetical protein
LGSGAYSRACVATFIVCFSEKPKTAPIDGSEDYRQILRLSQRKAFISHSSNNPAIGIIPDFPFRASHRQSGSYISVTAELEHVVVCGPMIVAAAAPVVSGKGSLTCPHQDCAWMAGHPEVIPKKCGSVRIGDNTFAINRQCCMVSSSPNLRGLEEHATAALATGRT